MPLTSPCSSDRQIYISEHWNLCILCLPHFAEHLADDDALAGMLRTLDVPSMMEFIIEYKHFPSFTPFRTRPFLEWAIQVWGLYDHLLHNIIC